MTATLDTAALTALFALIQQSPETACRTLDEVGAGAGDLEADALRPLWAILEEHARGRRQVDVTLVVQRLAGRVGRDALTEVLTGYATPGTERQRLEALRETAARRRILEGMRGVAARLKAGDALASIEADLRALPVLAAAIAPRVRSAKGDTLRLVTEAEVAWKEKRGPSLRTGWQDFDAELRLTPNLHAIGAHPGVGKSALVAGLTRQWTHAGVMVGVLAYEDDGLDLQRRMLACEAELDLGAVSGDRMLSETEQDRWADGHRVREACEEFLWLDDAHPRGTVADVCASIRAMRATGCKVAILDNLSCVSMAVDDERHHAIEDALLRLRETAIELRMPIVVIGHMKRSSNQTDEVATEPRLTDFAGAAAWERFARSCCGMWRGSTGPRLVVLKQNQGKVGGRFEVVMRDSAACVVNVQTLVETSREESRTWRRHAGE